MINCENLLKDEPKKELGIAGEPVRNYKEKNCKMIRGNKKIVTIRGKQLKQSEDVTIRRKQV